MTATQSLAPIMHALHRQMWRHHHRCTIDCNVITKVNGYFGVCYPRCFVYIQRNDPPVSAQTVHYTSLISFSIHACPNLKSTQVWCWLNDWHEFLFEYCCQTLLLETIHSISLRVKSWGSSQTIKCHIPWSANCDLLSTVPLWTKLGDILRWNNFHSVKCMWNCSWRQPLRVDGPKASQRSIITYEIHFGTEQVKTHREVRFWFDLSYDATEVHGQMLRINFCYFLFVFCRKVLPWDLVYKMAGPKTRDA